MMKDAILKFAEQLRWEPVIENADKLPRTAGFFLTGMGGSHLNADLLLALDPSFDIIAWRDYGLPPLSEIKLKSGLVIASSYSGNTEEAVAAYKEAKERGLPLAVIAVGGKLIELAKEDGVPYVHMPDTGIQPRSALGFSFMALCKLARRDDFIAQMHTLAKRLNPAVFEAQGRELAQHLKDHVPVVYCSRRNETIAWNWKIKLNETGKIPACYNVFPELNHNEMTGFDVKDASRHLSDGFSFLILKDSEDHPQIQKRMGVVEKLYMDRALPVVSLELEGESRLEKIFSSLIIADWCALYSAELYGLESEQVPMVEEFKKMVA